MSRLNDRMPGRVETIINRYGVNAIFYVDTSTYDPTTRQRSGGTVTPIVVRVTPASNDINKWQDATVNGADFSRIVFAAKNLSFTPVTGMMVKIGTKEFKIIELQNINSGESIAAYKAHLR